MSLSLRSRSSRRIAAVSVIAAVGLGVGASSAWASSTAWSPASQTVSGKAQFTGNYK